MLSASSMLFRLCAHWRHSRAVIGALRPGADDQDVVRERGAVGQHDVPCGRIDVDHFAGSTRVFFWRLRAPQGRSDLAFGQGPVPPGRAAAEM